MVYKKKLRIYLSIAILKGGGGFESLLYPRPYFFFFFLIRFPRESIWKKRTWQEKNIMASEFNSMVWEWLIRVISRHNQHRESIAEMIANIRNRIGTQRRRRRHKTKVSATWLVQWIGGGEVNCSVVDRKP